MGFGMWRLWRVWRERELVDSTKEERIGMKGWRAALLEGWIGRREGVCAMIGMERTWSEIEPLKWQWQSDWQTCGGLLCERGGTVEAGRLERCWWLERGRKERGRAGCGTYIAVTIAARFVGPT